MEQLITIQENLTKIGNYIKGLFNAAKEEIFEDGIESQFSISLIKVIERHEEAALEVITNLIINESVNAEVASEALRWIGDMRHEPTHENRLNLLEQSLNCSSIKVRDGAVLGLSFLDDPRAIDSIKEAMKRENSKLL